jgi:hypothetical protein
MLCAYCRRCIKSGEEIVADYGPDYWVAMGRSLQVGTCAVLDNTGSHCSRFGVCCTANMCLHHIMC